VGNIGATGAVFWQESTSRTLRAINIEDHVDSLLNLKDALAAILGAKWSHIDGHALPGSIEELVAVEKARNAGLAFTWQEL
jgi:hypothetical protein